MPKTFVALGSNVGDRLAAMAAALTGLDAALGCRVEAVSHAYSSEPWGVIEQPAFANAVAMLSFDGTPEDLLALCKGIERRLGRSHGERYGPRTIDLDILLFGGRRVDTPGLTIPHPRMLERDFVVTPLLELAPDVRLPDGERVTRSAVAQGRVTGTLGVIPGFGPVTPGESSREGR